MVEEEILACDRSMKGMLRHAREILSVMTGLEPFRDVFRRELAGSVSALIEMLTHEDRGFHCCYAFSAPHRAKLLRSADCPHARFIS